MRNLIFILLALNILYFLWPRESQAPRPPLTRGKGEYPMLVQLTEIDARPSARSFVPEEYKPIKPKRQNTVRIQAPKPKFARIKAPAPEKGESNRTESVSNASAQASSSQLSSLASQGITQPGLTSEDIEPQLDGDDTVVDGSVITTDVLSCYTVGPFYKNKKLNEFTNELKVLGADTTVRSALERRTRGYWVFLSSAQSREEAVQITAELASKGFTDYLIVSNDKYKNAVSLGLFTLKSGSERRVNKLKSMGFDPQVELRFTELKVFWLDYSIVQDFDWDTFQDQHFPKGRIERLKRECT